MALNAVDPTQWGELEPHDSSCVEATKWTSGELEVHFTDGTIYTYHGVSPLVYANFLRALSKGWFFNTYIRNRYSYS